MGARGAGVKEAERICLFVWGSFIAKKKTGKREGKVLFYKSWV